MIAKLVMQKRVSIITTGLAEESFLVGIIEPIEPIIPGIPKQKQNTGILWITLSYCLFLHFTNSRVMAALGSVSGQRLSMFAFNKDNLDLSQLFMVNFV